MGIVRLQLRWAVVDCDDVPNPVLPWSRGLFGEVVAGEGAVCEALGIEV